MPNYFIINAGQRQPIQLQTPRLGGGGEADIFRISDFAGCVAKIYLVRQGGSHASREKLQAMLNKSPQNMWTQVNGEKLPIFAWPTHIIEDGSGLLAGFLMPEIPMDRAVTLEKYMSRRTMLKALSLDDRSLPRRLHVCRNLASTIAEMHRQSHYFVDLKPQNILMFKDTGVVTLVDNDSFSVAGVGGGPRFPAAVMSSEYFAPELLRNGMGAASIVNDTQDRFALAAMIFQIFNNGVHPFSGTPTVQTNEGTIDSRIKLGQYAYGRVPNPSIRPTPASVHDCWDTSTRTLFDRAFTAQPSQRPSAEEWRNHLDTLGSTKGNFAKCSAKPTDLLHIHFSGMLCPECRMDQLDNSAVHVPPVSSPMPASVSTRGTTAPTTNKPWLNWAVAAIIAVVLVWFAIESRTSDSVRVPVGSGSNAEDRVASTTPVPVAILEKAPNTPSAQAADSPPSSATAPAAGILSRAQSVAAQGLANINDQEGITARMAGIGLAIPIAINQNQNDLMAVLGAGQAGDDEKTLLSAKRLMRDTRFTAQFEGWESLRKYARPISEGLSKGEAYVADLTDAVARQSLALAFDPRDREISGNLAFYVALNGKTAQALNIAVYSLSLPREPDATGRRDDWNLVGSMFAKLGRLKESEAAFNVGLAITGNLSRFCKSLLKQQSQFGNELNEPVTAVLQRIAQRGQSEEEGCSYPPVWL